MIVSLIAAMSENRVIGRDNDLPWHIPHDLKRFKAITSGHIVIMGRKTFDSIGKPLPNRPNIVVTRQNVSIPGVEVASSIDSALKKAKELAKSPSEEIFILGGGEIYKQTVEQADKIYLTVVHTEVKGDAYFPEFDESKFRITFEESHSEPIPFTFRDYSRV